MIVDKLDKFHLYTHVHPLFKEAFLFLQKHASLPFDPSKQEVRGKDLIAIIEESKGKTEQHARLEAHRKYIDIQYVYEGHDKMGWSPLERCKHVSESYIPEKDILFFSDRPESWVYVPKGYFTVFFPEDAHAPLAFEGHVKKIIMKVALYNPS